MSSLKGKVGLWTNSAQKARGHLHDIKALGFDYVTTRCIYKTGSGFAVNPPALQLFADGSTINLEMVAWAYVYPTGIQDQIDAIKDFFSQVGKCAELILDAEDEWLKQPESLAHDLFHGIAEAIGHRANLHLSSFCNPDKHPIPYKAFLSHCSSFMPQAYVFAPTTPATILGRTLGQAQPLVAGTLEHEFLPTVNDSRMLSLVKGGPFAGANVWLWDGDQQDRGVLGNENDWRPAIASYKE